MVEQPQALDVPARVAAQQVRGPGAVGASAQQRPRTAFSQHRPNHGQLIRCHHRPPPDLAPLRLAAAAPPATGC